MELQEYIEEIDALGVSVVAVLYDSPEELSRFKAKHRLSFHLVSDPESKVIKDLGLLNDEMEPGTRYYGVPYPGVFLLDSSNRVIAKYAEMDYRDRPLFSDILDGVRSLND